MPAIRTLDDIRTLAMRRGPDQIERLERAATLVHRAARNPSIDVQDARRLHLQIQRELKKRRQRDVQGTKKRPKRKAKKQVEPQPQKEVVDA